MRIEEVITKEPVYEQVLKGYRETKTQIYIATDGKKFYDKYSCEKHEKENELENFATYCDIHGDELDERFSSRTIELSDDEMDTFQCERSIVWVEGSTELRKYIFNTLRTSSSSSHKQRIYKMVMNNIELDFPCWVALASADDYVIGYFNLSKRVENLQEALKSFKEKAIKIEGERSDV